ncbi:MAG: SPOR domain-containing protein [Ignavibacteriaceae bacterium]|nr:SPOR domain-containing protein [Ignavibacteriaceae bacterium]
MIAQDELLKYVAGRCGISPEISNYFFEVFINRLSSRLKTGEVIQFDNLGYFQKRRCRIPAEKTDSKSSESSHLVPLILFSDDPEIQNDLKTFIYFGIPDIKTLWEEDKDLESSLKAGDFSPHTTRSQLINSFATKAEVIISGLKKNDKFFEEEFVFPFGFKPKFKESADSKSNSGFESIHSGSIKSDDTPITKKAVKDAEAAEGNKKINESSDSSLPWNIGKKFYDKKVEQPSPEDFKAKKNKELQSKSDDISKQHIKETADSDKKIDAEEALDAAIEESEIDKEISRFREFQPVKSRLSSTEINKSNIDEQSNLRLSKKKDPSSKSDTSKPVHKFTEVKSKSEVYHLRADIKKIQNKNKLPDDNSINVINTSDSYKSFRQNRNFIPLIMIFSIIIIAGAVIYFYLFKDDGLDSKTVNIVKSVNPPADVTVIDRDYEFAVTYPYAKTDKEIPLEGINPNVFLTEQVASPKEEPVKPIEKVSEPVVEKKIEVKPEVPPKIEQKVEPEVTEQKSSRIFLYNNYYVVFVGSYKSYTAADNAAEKYFDEGYNAFIEVEEIPGKPTRYNLNVGDFTSEEFARQFQEKYIK